MTSPPAALKPIPVVCRDTIYKPVQRGVFRARELEHKQGRLLTWKQSSVAVPPALTTPKELTRFMLQPVMNMQGQTHQHIVNQNRKHPKVTSLLLGMLVTMQPGERAFPYLSFLTWIQYLGSAPHLCSFHSIHSLRSKTCYLPRLLSQGRELCCLSGESGLSEGFLRPRETLQAHYEDRMHKYILQLMVN